jgi:hypothetical protein
MDVDDLVRHSVLRRCWFLSKAAECGDFARAIEMARVAEEFVIGPSGDERTNTLAPARDPVHDGDARDGDARDGESTAILETTISAPPPAAVPDTSAIKTRHDGKSSRLAMPAARRDELLDRLAQGARNHELAILFGVSPQQIQGVRMGAAREITQRRSRTRHSEADDESEIEATVDDVVRYLRQQDDVVVRQEDGTFLVNGRFRLDASELVAKANRMLERQHKPVFKTGSLDCGLRTADAARDIRANGQRHS